MNNYTDTDTEPDERTSLLRSKRPSIGHSKLSSSQASNYQYQQQMYLNQLLQTALNDRRSRFKQNLSYLLTLTVYTLERFAFYGLICNYVLYLNKQPLYWESFNASFILLIFFGVLNITSVLGGWIADAFIGKYLTICLSFIIYILGYAAFPLLSYHKNSIPNYCNSNSSIIDWTILNKTLSSTGYLTTTLKPDRSLIEETCSWVIILTVVLIGVAVGFIRANLGPFGADQVISRGQTMVFKYFNWLYWSINLGSLLAFSVLAYIQQNFNFFIGYLIPLICLILSFLLFLIGSFSYIKKDSETSVLSNIIKIYYEAFKSKKRQQNFLKQKQRERAMLSEEDENENEQLDSASMNNEDNIDYNSSVSYKRISWLDNAKIRYGGSFDDNQVDDVKSLKKILILFALLVPYWIVYFQIETTFIIQALHMKLFSRSKITGVPSFMIPAAWLSIADQVAILIMIPLMDSFVYPIIRRKFKSFISENTRLVFGMCLSALSVVSAGLLESVRLNTILTDPLKNTVIQIIDNTSYTAADLNILWQIPQYTLMGLGEVFCSVTCLYYAYSAAPKSMQSIIMGLFYFFSGLGSLFGSLFLWSFKSVIFTSSNNIDDINCPTCKFNYYFYFIGIVQIIGIGLFVLIDCKFSIVRCRHEFSRRQSRQSVMTDSVGGGDQERRARIFSRSDADNTDHNNGTNNTVNS